MRWLLGRSLAADGKLTPDLLDSIPGLPQERKSPMGELHWIFTAVTDSIAWDVLPSHLFQKLFRQVNKHTSLLKTDSSGFIGCIAVS